MSLPVANSQFYTAAVSSIASMLSPIAQAPAEKEENENFPSNSVQAPASAPLISSVSAPLFELTEEVRLL